MIFENDTNNNVNNNDKNRYHISHSSYRMAKVKPSHSKPGLYVVCDNDCVKVIVNLSER